MKMPRQLTANGKAATGAANNGPRGGVEKIDKNGFITVVGSMSTAPQNDAGVSDLSPRYEEFDLAHRVWQTANPRTAWVLGRMTPAQRAAHLRVRVGLIRVAAGNAHGVVDGEAWECPRDYDVDLNKEDMLRKALKCGLLSLAGRTYKLRQLRPDTFAVTRASGTVNFTREALLDGMARGSL